ncbi:MAG: helix-turn-helix transcriptional regulator [Coriobacteriales bacterium]|nr:helix-turn-helix transcriptional regulator [Coriobacteriales bacterium]
MNNRIAELRRTAGLTQQALADELGVSRQTIISLERGKYNPSIFLAHRIASRFGLAIEQVFLFEGDE